MRKIEREALMLAMQECKNPRTCFNEVNMLDTPEFKLGWQRAIEHATEMVTFIISAGDEQLKRHMRTWR